MKHRNKFFRPAAHSGRLFGAALTRHAARDIGRPTACDTRHYMTTMTHDAVERECRRLRYIPLPDASLMRHRTCAEIRVILRSLQYLPLEVSQHAQTFALTLRPIARTGHWGHNGYLPLWSISYSCSRSLVVYHGPT